MTLHLLVLFVSCIFDFAVYFFILIFTYLYTLCILHIFCDSHCRHVTPPIITATIFNSILRRTKWQFLSFYSPVLSCCIWACTFSSRVAMKLAFVYYWLHIPVQVCSFQTPGASRRSFSGQLGAYCLDEWLSDGIRTSTLMGGDGSIRPKDEQSRHTVC